MLKSGSHEECLHDSSEAWCVILKNKKKKERKADTPICSTHGQVNSDPSLASYHPFQWHVYLTTAAGAISVPSTSVFPLLFTAQQWSSKHSFIYCRVVQCGDWHCIAPTQRQHDREVRKLWENTVLIWEKVAVEIFAHYYNVSAIYSRHLWPWSDGCADSHKVRKRNFQQKCEWVLQIPPENWQLKR